MDSQALDHYWQTAQRPEVLYGVLGAFGVSAYFVWRIARRIVQIGYFVLFSIMGTLLAAGAGFGLNGRLAPFPILAVVGLGFGIAASAVRSKIMKAVGAATVLVVGHGVGTYWPKVSGMLKGNEKPPLERHAKPNRHKVPNHER
jgi:hypothetical protein